MSGNYKGSWRTLMWKDLNWTSVFKQSVSMIMTFHLFAPSYTKWHCSLWPNIQPLPPNKPRPRLGLDQRHERERESESGKCVINDRGPGHISTLVNRDQPQGCTGQRTHPASSAAITTVGVCSKPQQADEREGGKWQYWLQLLSVYS